MKFFVKKIVNYFRNKKKQHLQKLIEIAKKEISKDPENFKLHERIAELYYRKKMFVPTIAECRTSITLGNESFEIYVLLIRAYLKLNQNNAVMDLLKVIKEEIKKNVKDTIKNLDDLEVKERNDFLLNYDHNQFYRLKSISDHINSIKKNEHISVLDIGGGEGLLSLFLPELNYILVEPDVNGISNTELQLFTNIKFDIIVSCHVFEHVEDNKKKSFLDSICSLSKDKVILLNPFKLVPERSNKHLDLIYKMTGYKWAKEHLECGLPSLELVEKYAEQNKYNYKCYPNGLFSTTTAYVFLNYFAALSKKYTELNEINFLFNTELTKRMVDCDSDPTGYLIELTIK